MLRKKTKPVALKNAWLYNDRKFFTIGDTLSSPEIGSNSPSVLAFDANPPGETPRPFHDAVLNELLASLAQEPDSSDCLGSVRTLANLGYQAGLPYLDQAQQAILASGITGDNRFDAKHLARSYARLGRFDKALALADEIDSCIPPQPGYTDQKTVLFRWHKDRIPEAYLEQAVLALASLGGKAVLSELYSLGEHQPAARESILRAIEQIVADRIVPGAETPEAADQALADATYIAAKWGDAASAITYYGKMQPNRRLPIELQVAEDAGILLGHQNLEQLYESITKDDSDLSSETKVDLLLQLHKLGHPVERETLWQALSSLEESGYKLWLISDFAKLYSDPAARQYLAESITEHYIETKPYQLLNIAEQHPGLLIDCRSTIASCLAKDGKDEWEQGAVATALLEDYIAIGQTEAAVALAQTFKGREVFGDGLEELAFQEKAVMSIAQKGRNHLEQALAMVAAFSEGADSFDHGSLMGKLVIAAHDYLTPDECTFYLEACDGDYMTYQGWLELALSTKRLGYLVKAKEYIKPDEGSSSTYRSMLLDLLKAHQQITSEAVAA